MKFLAISLLLLGVYTNENAPVVNEQGVHIETILPNVEKVSTLQNIPLNVQTTTDTIVPVLQNTQNVENILPHNVVPLTQATSVPTVAAVPNFISTTQPVFNAGPIPTAVTHQSPKTSVPQPVNSNLFTPFIQQTAQKAANAVNEAVHTSKTSIQNAVTSVVNFVKPSTQQKTSSQHNQSTVNTQKEIPTPVSSQTVSQKVSVSLTKSQYLLSLSTLLIVTLSTLFLQ